MKANKKFVEDKEAVSAVIGVILMVAITVAIAATVYVYVSGMMDTGGQTAPELTLVKDNVADTLQIASADPSNLKYGDLEMTLSSSGITRTTTWGDWGTTSEDVDAGDTFYFSVSGESTVSIRHIDTNTLLGTWSFS